MEVKYNLRFIILYKNFEKALDIFNEQETMNRLEEHCKKRCSGNKVLIKDENGFYFWYSYPKKFDKLEDAFRSWNIVDNNVKMVYDEESFKISGNYHFLIGEQYFLFEKLKPILYDCDIIHL